MARKITLEHVREVVGKEGYTLLNTEINSHKDKLFLICPNGHEYSTSYSNFQSNNRRCVECKKNEQGLQNYYIFKNLLDSENYTLLTQEKPILMHDTCEVMCSSGHHWKVNCTDFKIGTRCAKCSGNVKLTQQEIKERYADEGYELISDYVNSSTKVVAICPNGHHWEHLPSNFKKGQRCFECFGCKKKELEYVKQVFINKGFIPKFNTYDNNKQMLPFICPKHEECGIQYARIINMERDLANCVECYHEKLRGENHHAWLGGVSTINSSLREVIYNTWTFPSLLECDFTCVLSGTKEDIVVHHLNKNFSEIRDEAFFNLNIHNAKQVYELTDAELRDLKKEFIKLHNDYGLGVVLNKDIHKLFHKLYGNKFNTKDQFEEFKIRYRYGEFNYILNNK